VSLNIRAKGVAKVTADPRSGSKPRLPVKCCEAKALAGRASGNQQTVQY